MYSTLPSFILGFHGCDKKVAEPVLSGKTRLRSSNNEYDWLGEGIYFWENNPARALQYARDIMNTPGRSKGKIKVPFVIGAVIDLGHCLNLLESTSLEILKRAYEEFKATVEMEDGKLPSNKPVGKEGDLLLRNLDCAVINWLHLTNRQRQVREYDTVRGFFSEGPELYPNAGFREKNHIQVCVVNPNCIKGYFRVLDPDLDYPVP